MKKPADPLLYVVVIGLLAALWWATTQEWQLAHKQLADLTKITGRLKASSQRRSAGKSHAYLVVFTVQQASSDSVRLGQTFGSDKQAAQNLGEVLRPGDEVTAYYDAAGLVEEGGYNYAVYQLETGNAVVYAIEQKRDEALTQAILLAFFAVGATSVAGFQWLKSQNYFDQDY